MTMEISEATARRIAQAAMNLDALEVELSQYEQRGNFLAARTARTARDKAAAALADAIASAREKAGAR